MAAFRPPRGSEGLSVASLASRDGASVCSSMRSSPRSRYGPDETIPRRFSSRHVPQAAEEIARRSEHLSCMEAGQLNGLVKYLKPNSEWEEQQKQAMESGAAMEDEEVAFRKSKGGSSTRAEQAKLAAQAKARERKEKMIAMEAKRKANLAKSDLEVEDEGKMSNLLENAERARDEQLDDVKKMNQMMLYAKCVTIRDAQLLEKQMIQKEKADHEKAIDMLMEQERLKAIELTEERERQKQEERLRGAAIIRMQIEQREKERSEEHTSELQSP